MLITNWLNSPKEKVFCSKDELINFKESLLCVIHKEDLRKCIIKNFEHKKVERMM